MAQRETRRSTKQSTAASLAIQKQQDTAVNLTADTDSATLSDSNLSLLQPICCDDSGAVPDAHVSYLAQRRERRGEWAVRV